MSALPAMSATAPLPAPTALRRRSEGQPWSPPALRLADRPEPLEELPAVDGSVRPGHDHVTIDPRLRHDMVRWVERYAQGVLEVVSGERPPTQLARWTRGDVHEDLTRRAHLVARARNGRASRPLPDSVRALVRGAHVSFVTAQVVEAAVHVRHGGGRSAALACRFEWRRDRWTCTALEFC